MKISKSERLLNLVSLLLKSPQPVPWQRIRGEVDGYNAPEDSEDAAERRFERDKEALRKLGVPVEYCPGGEGKGYYVPRNAYYLPRIELTPEEAAILALVTRAAEHPAHGELGANLRTALQKLQFDSPIPGDVRETVEERYLFYHARRPEGDAREVQLSTLSEALVRRHPVRFSYRRSDGETAARTVDPYGLAYWQGHWYLVGRDHGRDATRIFRTDRIRETVQIVDEGAPAYEIPEDFSVHDYVGRLPWQLAGEHAVRVQIRFDEVVAWMVKRSDLENASWVEHDDGSASVTCTARDTRALLRWLLRFGGRAELMAPEALRREMAHLLRDVRRLYEPAERG